MHAHKFGSDALGVWERDEQGLPCYALDTTKMTGADLPLCHLIGSGRISLLADAHGVLRLIVTVDGQPRCLPAPGTGFRSALYARVVSETDSTTPRFAGLPAGCSGVMRWGIGFVSYEAQLPFGPDGAIHSRLEIAAPPEQRFLSGRLCLCAKGTAAGKSRITLHSDLRQAAAAAPASEPSGFSKDGTAILMDAHPELGDLYLAAPHPWTARPLADALELEITVELVPDTMWEACFVLGCGRDTTVEWIQAQLTSNSPASAGAAWAQRLEPAKIRAPELWMQDECVWASGRLLNCRVAIPNQDYPVVVAAGNVLLAPAFQAAAPGLRPSTRSMLSLGLALSAWAPEQALQNLLCATRCQAASGRMPERLAGTCAAEIDPSRDRSDVEIWLLLGWAEHTALFPNSPALDMQVPFADGDTATVWEHLQRACRWVRTELDVGTHELIRLLAGDWNCSLNRAGTDGHGESVLNSAMACYALQRLVLQARRRDEQELADELDAWQRALRMAVGRAFDEHWFRRGYTDSGQPLGAGVQDRVYTAAQAWCVLARCGSLEQRRQAMTRTLAATRGIGPALPVISRPYTLPPAPNSGHAGEPPGEGWNSGISMEAGAWFAWALASEGDRKQALHEWERLSIRRRSAEAPHLSAALLMNLAACNSSQATARCGQASTAQMAVGGWLPDARAVAWDTFALHRILS